jgi:hypothetical protein
VHCLLKIQGRIKRGVGFDFHNVQLQFFAKSELGHFNKVDDFSALGFDDFVADWQGLQVLVHYGVFVFWSKDFEGLVRKSHLCISLVRFNGAKLPFLNLP